MKGSLRDNGLSLVLISLFVLFFASQTVSGWLNCNDDKDEHHQPQIGLRQYLGTGSFGEAVFENWESEFLQMGLYVILTVFLFQRGSSESKDPDKKEYTLVSAISNKRVPIAKIDRGLPCAFDIQKHASRLHYDSRLPGFLAR